MHDNSHSQCPSKTKLIMFMGSLQENRHSIALYQKPRFYYPRTSNRKIKLLSSKTTYKLHFINHKAGAIQEKKKKEKSQDTASR